MIIYRETKQKILNIIGISVLVICVFISSLIVFMCLTKADAYQAKIGELHQLNEKYKDDIAKLDDESFGIISGEVVTAKEFGQTLATDMEKLADKYSLLYKTDIKRSDYDYVNQLFSNISVKFDGIVRTASAADTLKEIAWTNNPKVSIRFESILNYDNKDIPCLFTMWKGENFYGYVTCVYDVKNGLMKDVEVTLSDFGSRHEKVYEEPVEDTTTPEDAGPVTPVEPAEEVTD